jgi:hypothetical protein
MRYRPARGITRSRRSGIRGFLCHCDFLRDGSAQALERTGASRNTDGPRIGPPGAATVRSKGGANDASGEGATAKTKGPGQKARGNA